MATQGERRARTRQALLDAAAELFAERGVEGSSVDAIAERGRPHLGRGLRPLRRQGRACSSRCSRAGSTTSPSVIGAELTTATTLDERLASLWRNVSDPPIGDGRWIALEHELWSYAARNDAGPRAPRPPLPRPPGTAVDEARGRVGRRAPSERRARRSSACCSAWR